MKNKILKFVLCGTVLAFASCNLDRLPEDSIPEDAFYSSDKEVEFGVIGAYEAVRDGYEDMWQLTELRSDNTQAKAGGIAGTGQYNGLLEIDYSNIYDTDKVIENVFNGLYTIINRCNVVLKYVDVVSDSAKRAKFKSEMLTLRAMVHFDLARLWGDVWYVDSAISGQEAAKMSKTSQSAIFDKIVADLEVAIAGLPTPADQPASEVGRFNAYAARTLLAKVYLTQKDYAKVKSTLQPIITDYGTTGLVPYADIFDIDSEMSKEIFFAVRNTSGNVGLGSTYTNQFGPEIYTTFPGGSLSGKHGPTDDLVRAFGNTYDWMYLPNLSTGELEIAGVDDSTIVLSADLRSNVCVQFYSNGVVGAWYNYKYFDDTCTLEDDANKDFPLIRYADAMLMYAEALNRTGDTSGAATYVNAIRARAGVAAISTTLSEADMHTAILLERRLEFAMENQRFFDMLREGDQYFMDVNNAVFVDDESYENIMLESLLPDPAGEVTAERILLPVPFATAVLY